MGNLGTKKKKVKKNFLHGNKDGDMVIGYTFRVGYIYRADCILLTPLLLLRIVRYLLYSVNPVCSVIKMAYIHVWLLPVLSHAVY